MGTIGIGRVVIGEGVDGPVGPETWECARS